MTNVITIGELSTITDVNEFAAAVKAALNATIARASSGNGIPIRFVKTTDGLRAKIISGQVITTVYWDPQAKTNTLKPIKSLSIMYNRRTFDASISYLESPYKYEHKRSVACIRKQLQEIVYTLSFWYLAYQEHYR